MKDSYTVFVTAVDREAPPILQWDREDARNPVSHYFWHGGSRPEQFGLTPGAFREVVGITWYPSMWESEDAYPHQGKGVVFVFDGAVESNSAGLALFPEILKAEYHGARSVIEAHSRSGKLVGGGEPSAIGIGLTKGGRWNARFRATSGDRTIEYTLDRWD